MKPEAYTTPANPVHELLAELTAQAQAVTLQTYQAFLHTIASLVVDGTIDHIQRESVIKALTGNGQELGGKRAITTVLTAAEKQTAIMGATWSSKTRGAGSKRGQCHLYSRLAMVQRLLNTCAMLA
jgi:hypothetical protein